MIRRHVLAALAVGVEAGNDDAARAEVRRADWVLRGPASRKLEAALLDAVLLTGELYTPADPDAMRHVQRAAALAVAGHDDVDFTDRQRVRAAYGALPLSAVPRAPIGTLLVSVAAAVAIALVAWSVVALRSHHRRARPPAPPVAGAYITGGAPASDPALEHVLADELASLVAETDRDRHGTGDVPTRASDLAALRASPVIAAHGAALTGAWRDMLDAFDHFVDVPVGWHGLHDAETELREHVHAVSDQLAALGLGYYLDGDVLVEHHVAHAVILAYRVDDVVFVHAAGHAQRVLDLRRLDHLNLHRAVLGMQSEQVGDPVVMLDQIDGFVATHVRPVIAGSPYPIGDPSWSVGQLAVLAGDAIGRELAGVEDPTLAVTRSVRRHEARHAIDRDRDTPLRYPRELAAYLGTASADDPFVRRARAELAAYLSQIANEPLVPQLALWNAASFAFHGDRWGTPEAYAAIVILEGLARRAHVPVVAAGQLDRSRLAGLAVPLAGLSDAALRDAARALWVELYGESCLPITE